MTTNCNATPRFYCPLSPPLRGERVIGEHGAGVVHRVLLKETEGVEAGSMVCVSWDSGGHFGWYAVTTLRPERGSYHPAEAFTLTGNPASLARVQVIRYYDGRMLLATMRGAVPISRDEFGELARCAVELARAMGIPS